MMRQPQSRWLMSFADLTLLLLAFFVMLHAQRGNPDRVVRSIAAALAPAQQRPVRIDPDAIFVSGEAIVRPEGRATIVGVAHRWPNDGRLRVMSVGTGGAGARFDRWEFAAARTAAIARELSAAGIAADKIDIDLRPAEDGSVTARQRIEIIHLLQ